MTRSETLRTAVFIFVIVIGTGICIEALIDGCEYNFIYKTWECPK